jgi:SAM-dependent methyltransferase
VSDAPWYRRWFGEEYLHLYPHRDLEEAEAAVDLLLARVPMEPGARVLDLACGAGRHLLALRRSGMDAVGLDLSLPLLVEALGRGDGAPLVRGDMRLLPFADGAFGAVTSFFTSFGYFETEDDDRRVLAEVRRVLAPGGHVLLDFLNAQEVRTGLTPRDERRIGEMRVVQERSLVDGGRVVEKRIRIESPASGEVRTFRERVRLYSDAELEALMADRGLRVRERMGDYRGAPFTPDAPRLILLAHAAEEPP